MLFVLALLAVTLFLLTLYSIVQSNAELFGLANSQLVSLKLLDTGSAASLFVTLIGALLVRHQFAHSLIPRINYKSYRSARTNNKTQDDTFETWRVEILNTGLGSAIINRTEYLFEPADCKNCSSSYTIDNIVKQFSAIDLIADRDYWIENIAAGFALTPKDDCFVFEIKMEHIQKIKRLEMILFFQSQLGNKYQREIALIPRS